MRHDQYFMEMALNEARKATELDEVPVGAVVVKDGEVIARAHNERETQAKPNGHAEVISIERAGEALNSWNLSGCTLYVTIEPCIMCAGTIIMSRIDTVVFGAFEPRGGSFGSTLNLLDIQGFNHYPEVVSGVMEEACSQIIVDYFRHKRNETIYVRKIVENEFEAYLKVRKTVFVDEQDVDESLEYDEYDDLNSEDVLHVGAYYQGTIIGTMRLIKKGKTLKVGRVAVLKEMRKKKVGNRLLEYAEKQAKNNGFDRLELGAQLTAKEFYIKNGYLEYGDLFMDAGIEHIMMYKTVEARTKKRD